MNYTKHLSEPWFTLVKLGIKSVEGRLNKGSFKDMKIGDTITFYNNDVIERNFKVKIVKINVYDSFKNYLKKETLKKTLPGYNKIQDGLAVYYKYFTREDEKTYKVKSFHLELL